MNSSKQGARPKSALTLLQEHRQSSHQPPCLMEHPSFPLHLGLTSLAGPAGSGKTQLCLSLVADCACKHQKAVYISLGSDDTARISKRLHQLLQHRTIETTTKERNHLSNIFVNWVRNQEDLLDLLEHKLPHLLSSHPSISVVVLDGMAALFRGHAPEQVKNHWLDRSCKFFQIASKCKRLSCLYRIPFLVTNEATTKIDSTNLIASKLEPALGLSWAQCVNCSLFVQRGHDTIRRITSIKSPHVASNVVGEFTIERQGTRRIK
jgi:RecA/RadA recombinase